MRLGTVHEHLAHTLLGAAGRHAAAETGVTRLATGRTLTYAAILRAALGGVETLRRAGLGRGDRVFAFTDDLLDVIPLLAACQELELGLALCPASAKQAHAALALRETGARLIVGPEALRDACRGQHGPVPFLSPAELAEPCGRAEPGPGPARRPDAGGAAFGVAEASPRPGPVWMSAEAVQRTVLNLCHAYPIGPGDRVLSVSGAASLSGLCTAVIAPMMLGADLILADDSLLDQPAAYWHEAARVGATVCELPASGIARLLRQPGETAVPAGLRFILAGSGTPRDADRRRAESAWGRRVYDGFGAPAIGYWASCRPFAGNPAGAGLPLPTGMPAAEPGFTLAIRKLRTPVTLLAADDGAAGTELGEIVIRSGDGPDAEERRTGELGRITAAGELVVADRLANLAIRDGRSVLLPEIDALLAEHPRITASKCFHEHGQAPGERIICACVTTLTAAEIRDWIAARVHRRWVPDLVVPVGRLPADNTALLRDMVSGASAADLLAALTARRFRRSPCHREPDLRALAQRSILAGEALRFFMLWGCGPRREAGAPDLAAIEAVHALLAAAADAAPVTPLLDVIFTDVHASNNGHSPEHAGAYFAAVERAAAGVPGIGFDRESAIWRRAGLTMERVRAHAATPEFEAKWQAFPLRDRFILQATRHSAIPDRTLAARQYYAVCALEREALKGAYEGATFLTYNGPEFNACFPDVPTLYIFPGPRGRTDKPWFVHGSEQAGGDHAPVPLKLAS